MDEKDIRQQKDIRSRVSSIHVNCNISYVFVPRHMNVLSGEAAVDVWATNAALTPPFGPSDIGWSGVSGCESDELGEAARLLISRRRQRSLLSATGSRKPISAH